MYHDDDCDRYSPLASVAPSVADPGLGIISPHVRGLLLATQPLFRPLIGLPSKDLRTYALAL